jgi:hypothetical protein
MPADRQRLPLSIVHYHDVFTNARARNPLLNGSTNVPADFLIWLEGKAESLACGNGVEGNRAGVRRTSAARRTTRQSIDLIDPGETSATIAVG